MNDHDMMIFDIVSKTSAMSVDTEAITGDVGMVVKCDNANCLADVHWFKSGVIEKVSSFDLHNHEITILSEFVIRKTPNHKLLSLYIGDDDEEDVTSSKEKGLESSVIYFNHGDYNPIGNQQAYVANSPSEELIVALSEESLEIAHVTQKTLTDVATTQSSDIVVGGIIGLDVQRPNMVQVPSSLCLLFKSISRFNVSLFFTFSLFVRCYGTTSRLSGYP